MSYLYQNETREFLFVPAQAVEGFRANIWDFPRTQKKSAQVDEQSPTSPAQPSEAFIFLCLDLGFRV